MLLNLNITIPHPLVTPNQNLHMLTDLLFINNINDNLKIYTEIANSNYSFSKTSSTKDTFTTEQENNIYALSKSPIEQDLSLYITDIHKHDIDYYINYETGEVTFINKTISSGFEVEISYNITHPIRNKKNVNAYSIESNYNNRKRPLSK